MIQFNDMLAKILQSGRSITFDAPLPSMAITDQYYRCGIKSEDGKKLRVGRGATVTEALIEATLAPDQ